MEIVREPARSRSKSHARRKSIVVESRKEPEMQLVVPHGHKEKRSDERDIQAEIRALEAEKRHLRYEREHRGHRYHDGEVLIERDRGRRHDDELIIERDDRSRHRGEELVIERDRSRSRYRKRDIEEAIIEKEEKREKEKRGKSNTCYTQGSQC